MDFQSEKSFGKLRLRAFQPYHQILCMSKHVEDVEDRSNTHKGCNAMYVEDVKDRSNTPKGCNAMLYMSKMSKMHSIECIEYCTKDQSNVEDVEDRSNTPKGCNAMYVEGRRRCIQMCTNYNVDSNTKYSNYIELRIKCSN